MGRISTIVSPFSDALSVQEVVQRHDPISCRLARSEDEIALHRALREAVFVHEQQLFHRSDYDTHDDDRDTLYALGLCGSVVGGVVRLYPLNESGRWKGDRLAVLPPFRKLMLGAELVRFAVRTAGELGGEEMIASIQTQNVRFFQFLGWHCVGEPYVYVGKPHQQMAITLQTQREESVRD